MNLNFTKWHGIGNDFILLYGYPEDEFDFKQLAVKMCDRHFGIGADGLVVILPSSSDAADFKMRIFNSDGSEADMCGNAVRCVARYLYENKITAKTSITLDTLAGLIKPELMLENGKADLVKVNMGQPRLTRGEMSLSGNPGEQVVNFPLDVDGKTYFITCVSMGNPHCVIFVDDIHNVPLAVIGPVIETHPMFPYKTNVEFAQALSSETIRMRVWERGVGITLACGTGVCATLVAGVLNKQSGREVVIKLDGGDLKVEWQNDNHIFLTGPAAEVFKGVFIS